MDLHFKTVKDRAKEMALKHFAGKSYTQDDLDNFIAGYIACSEDAVLAEDVTRVLDNILIMPEELPNGLYRLKPIKDTAKQTIYYLVHLLESKRHPEVDYHLDRFDFAKCH